MLLFSLKFKVLAWIGKIQSLFSTKNERADVLRVRDSNLPTVSSGRGLSNFAYAEATFVLCVFFVGAKMKDSKGILKLVASFGMFLLRLAIRKNDDVINEEVLYKSQRFQSSVFKRKNEHFLLKEKLNSYP